MLSQKLLDFYSKLQDAQSKGIFKNRLSFLLDRDMKNIDNMILEVLKNKRMSNEGVNSILDITDFYRPEKRIVFYGAGGEATLYKQYLKKNMNLSAHCFCDTDSKKWGTSCCGLPVISPDSLNAETDLICISTSCRYHAEIYGFLLKTGFLANQIFAANFDIEYFCPSIFTPSINGDDIYIDAGCYDGNTIKGFIDFCGGKYAKIYGFEPDAVSFKNTKKFIDNEEIANVELYNEGLWSTDGILSFQNNKGQGSHIANDGSSSVQVRCIDSIVKDSPVTFIKMDIEGAELEALRGAANTIKKYKPKLAICIYHKPEDIIDIPLFIQELVPEYRFYIRHHDIYSVGTVLYALAY